MIYRQRNKKRNIVFKSIFIFFIVLFVLRFFNNSIVIRLVDYPINYVLDSSSGLVRPFKDTLDYFKDKKDLENQINQLKQENLELKLNQIVQQTNTQEFEYFIQTFGIERVLQTELFRVISKPPFVSFDTLRITGNLEKYSQDSLIFYKDILIGKIIEKNNTYATVQLFSSPGTKTKITVRGAQFESTGLGSGRYVFELAKDFEIQEKDIITFADRDVYVLGVVELIESGQEDLFKKVYFNIPVPLSSISYVSINN